MPKPSTRTYSDSLNSLDIRSFQGGRKGKRHLLVPGTSFFWQWIRRGVVVANARMCVHAGHIDISCRDETAGQTGEWLLSIGISWSDCHLGGARSWWLCPGCGRRVAVLFGWGHFQCRECRGVHYKCQSETEHARTLRRANKLRRRLTWEPGVANGWGVKPAGMHWRTYQKLFGQYASQEQLIFQTLTVWLDGPRR